MATLLLADHDSVSLKDTTAKAMTAALALGHPVHVLVAGHNARAAADAAAAPAVIRQHTRRLKRGAIGAEEPPAQRDRDAEATVVGGAATDANQDAPSPFFESRIDQQSST